MMLNRNNVNVDDIVLNGVLSLMNSNPEWSGTMTQLSNNLVKVLDKKQIKMLPGSPSALRIVLNRIVNRLRNRKVSIKFGRTPDHTRTRFVKLAR